MKKALFLLISLSVANLGFGLGAYVKNNTDKYACFHCGIEFHFDCASECTVTCDGKCENAFCHECKLNFYII